MIHKNKRYLELGLSFWIGVGLMCIINVVKIIYTRQALLYDWIMFGISIIMVVICIILLRTFKK